MKPPRFIVVDEQALIEWHEPSCDLCDTIEEALEIKKENETNDPNRKCKIYQLVTTKR